MSVTLSPLPEMAFSRNPIVAELISDDVVDVPGVAASWQIDFLAAIPTLTEIPLKWGNRVLVMTAELTPDGSGNEFPSGDGSAGYVSSIAAYFEANYYLDQDFTVVASPGEAKLIFTARKEGAEMNILPKTGDFFSINILTTGGSTETKPNFKHFLEVWVAAKRVKTLTLSLNPDASITTKDVSEIIHAAVSAAGSDKPDLAATNWQIGTNTLLPYYLKYAQFYGNDPLVKRLHRSPTRWVNRGGLNVQAAYERSLASYLRPEGIDADTLCLRQGSTAKMVQPEQPEFLYWINLTGDAHQVALKVLMMFTDNDTKTITTASTVAEPNTKHFVAVGIIALNLLNEMPVGKTLQAYTVTIVSATDAPLSLTYTYIPDKYRRFPRYFIYLNALGGYQTLYTYGKAEPITEVKKQVAMYDVSLEQAAKSGRIGETNIRMQQGEVVNSGYKTPREVRLIQDFLLSDEKYKVEGDKLIPIGTKADKLPLPADGQNLNAASFEWYPLYEESVFTEDNREANGTLLTGGCYPTIPGGNTGDIEHLQDQINTLAARSLPPGGVTGQVLSKVDGLDYNAHWTDAFDAGGSASGIEAFTDTISFTYNGSNNVHKLNFTPKQLGFTTINGQGIDGYRDYQYVDDTIVLNADQLALAIGTVYRLKTLYFK